MDLELASESKIGYTVSLSSRWIIVCVIANLSNECEPLFPIQYADKEPLIQVLKVVTFVSLRQLAAMQPHP